MAGAAYPARELAEAWKLVLFNQFHDTLGGAAIEPAYEDSRDGELYTFQDQGRQEFTYRLVPHGGDWRAASVVGLAAELNQPAFPLLESYHDGDLPQQLSFMTVSPAAWCRRC